MISELGVLVFMDLANLDGQGKAVGRRIDIPKLVEFLALPSEGRRLIDAYLYATLPPQNGDKVARWHDYLRHSGINVVAKRAKRLPSGEIKGNIDSLLILDAMDLVPSIRPDIVVLVTGDGGFAPLALKLRRYGVRVEVAGTSGAMASELRAAANGVIDLDPFLRSCPGLDGHAAAPIGTDAILEGF